jgi:hypothetical protein
MHCASAPLHLLKLAVGIDDLDDLCRARAVRATERGGHWVPTRNYPRRAAEVLDGGSLYWVVRGRIAARQRVAGFRSRHDAAGHRYCLIDVDPELVLTVPQACRAFQGWRYLPATSAPPDCISAVEESPSDRMLAELRALGLI